MVISRARPPICFFLVPLAVLAAVSAGCGAILGIEELPAASSAVAAGAGGTGVAGTGQAGTGEGGAGQAGAGGESGTAGTSTGGTAGAAAGMGGTSAGAGGSGGTTSCLAGQTECDVNVLKTCDAGAWKSTDCTSQDSCFKGTCDLVNGKCKLEPNGSCGTCKCPDGGDGMGMPCHYKAGTTATGQPGTASNAIDGTKMTFQSFSNGTATTTITLSTATDLKAVRIIWLAMGMNASSVTCNFNLSFDGTVVGNAAGTGADMGVTETVVNAGMPKLVKEIFVASSCTNQQNMMIAIDEIAPIPTCM